MSTSTLPIALPAALLAELQAAADQAAAGVKDSEAARQACERMDRMREELRQQRGEMSVAVQLLRQTRDEG